MWLAPIHDVGFVNRTLKSIEGSEKDYGTWPRIKGMLTLAANVSVALAACRSQLNCRKSRTRST
jgi:tRNA G26 N,N-dimethylase Trm1